MEPRNRHYLDGLHISIKVSFIYLIVGVLWILFSDRLLIMIVKNQEVINQIQTVKGFLYVFITAVLVYLLIVRFNRHQDQLIKELKISETKYRTLLNNLPVSIFQKDSDLVYRSSNQVYEEYIGKPESEIIEHDDFKIFDESRAQKYRDEDHVILETGEPIVYDEKIGEGQERKYFTVIKAPYYIEHQIQGILGIILDTTLMKKQEYEFKKLYTAIDKSNYGVVITDPEGIVEYVNEAYEEITGYENHEMTGKTINMVRTNYHAPKIYKHIRETLEKGQTWKGELYNIRKDGTTYWERNIIMPIIEEDGEIVNYVAFKEDITKEKELNRKMKELQVLRDVIIDDSDVWVNAFNKEGKLVLWNRAAEKISGYSAQESMKKKTVFGFLCPDPETIQKVEEEFIQRVRRGELCKDYIVKITTKQGEEKYMSFEGKSLASENVFRDWNIVMGFDVTRRIKADLALQKMNEDLEERVVQRTEELHRTNDHLERSMAELEESQAQLTEAYDDLGKSHEKLIRTQEQLIMSEKLAALGDLVASVAHEINTPLGIGVTLSTFLQEKHKELARSFSENTLSRGVMKQYIEAGEEAIELMVLNLHRASELVTSFKQVASDQATLELRKFKVKAYIEETLISLKPRFKNTNHQIYVKCEKEMEIISYPGAVSQIITNLVMNSLIHGFEHTENGIIRIDIKSHEKEVVIDYQDNGKGIAPNDQHQVFKPFYTTRRKEGSTGLGLHIVYNTVVQILKGRIELLSDVDQGVRFTIEMPVVQEHELSD